MAYIHVEIQQLKGIMAELEKAEQMIREASSILYRYGFIDVSIAEAPAGTADASANGTNSETLG